MQCVIKYYKDVKKKESIMKKTFLILSIAAVLVCLLAIAVSADGIKKFDTDEFQSGENITYIEGINLGAYYSSENKGAGIDTLYDNTNIARIVLKNSDGTYTTYPTYYFVRTQDDWQGDYQFIMCNRINDMASVTGETYTNESIIRIEYPELNPNHTFGRLSANVEGVTGCKNLKYAYISSQFKVLNKPFDGLKNLEVVEFAPNAQITAVAQFSFRGTSGLQKIIFPNTLESLNREALKGCAGLTELSLGANFVKFNDSASLNTLGTTNQVKIYVPSTLDGSVYGASYFPKKSIVMFTGDKAAAEAFGFSAVMSYDEYLAAGSVAEDGAIIYGYYVCDAFYNGEHGEGEALNSCQFGCPVCGKAELLDNPQHELNKTVAFGENGYFSTVCVVESCSVCKTETLNESVEAIFISYGYSVTEAKINGKLSMSQFFGIDKANLEKYTALTNESFEFGFVVSSNADPMNEANSDLIAQGKTYVTTQSKIKHDYFEIKVSGFTDANSNSDLAFCVYVKDGEKLSYLDNRETVEAVELKSYNDIKAILENKTEVNE